MIRDTALKAAAKALYDRERAREDNLADILSTAAGKPVASQMEPWDQCEEMLTEDARCAITAYLAALPLDTGLVERLRATEHRGMYAPGHGMASSNGDVTVVGLEPILELRNPDGPEAADTITRLSVELREARAGK